MWNRGGLRSSALDRAKAQLSGQRIANTGKSKDKRDVDNNEKFLSPGRQTQFQDVRDISSLSHENQDLAKSFIMGGGSRFLKKTSKDATGDRLSSAPADAPSGVDDLKFIPHRNSQSAALSRLALIENRIINQKSKGNGPINQRDLPKPQETSSDPSLTASRFLKKKTMSAPQEEKAPEREPGLSECKERKVSLDSDEQDIQRLLGDSLSLSEGSLQIVSRHAVEKKSSEMSTVLSPTPERNVFNHRTPSSSPRRPESCLVRFSECSVSSETNHSEVRSLDDLFPVAAALESDDTLSEMSEASEGFKLNVMTLDDLAPIPFEAAETSAEKKETQDRNKKSSNHVSKIASLHTPEDASANYESDFESEIPSETTPSVSEISEHLTDDDKDPSLVSEAQYSSFKSQEDDEDDDQTLSQSSVSSSQHSNSSSKSSSSTSTVTRGPSPEPNVKEAAVQTQVDGFSYTWSSGMAAAGPSLGMTYVDPTPIASHTVSTEAIESLTSYSPAIFALNDMLRQQLALTRAFTDSTRRHYASVIESLGPADYKYTTLQDTKEFIRAHRPPKMSFDDALEEVLQETRNRHYI